MYLARSSLRWSKVEQSLRQIITLATATATATAMTEDFWSNSGLRWEGRFTNKLEKQILVLKTNQLF
jgi:SRSO17 transposase